MPSTRGFQIDILDTGGETLTNYGTRTRGNLVYTHIEAKQGLGFQVRVRPSQPFPDPDHIPALRSLDQTASQEPMEYDPVDHKPCAYFAYVYMDGSTTHDAATRVRMEKDKKPRFLKGRVYLPEDGESATETGDTSMASTMSVLPWIFSERGIDVVFNGLNLSGAEVDVPETEHDAEMAELTQALSREGLTRPINRKRGMIEVAIKRVVKIEPVPPGEEWKLKPEEEVDNGNTHKVTFGAELQETIPITVWRCAPYRSDEAFFCKVTFHYHDISKLVRMGLSSREGIPITDRQLRAWPTPARNPDREKTTLKRLQGSGAEIEAAVKHGDQLDDDEDEDFSPVESSSDSDVQPFKRRGAVARSRKGTLKQTIKDATKTASRQARKDTRQALGWTAPKGEAAERLSLELSLPEFTFDPNDQVSGWVNEGLEKEGVIPMEGQLKLADTGFEQGEVQAIAGLLQLAGTGGEDLELEEEGQMIE